MSEIQVTCPHCAGIDWERNRITVSSPKTARHAGHESRVDPLFPELRPYPPHVAAARLGHSTRVAQKHHWTVTDGDFERAAKGTIEGGAESGARRAKNAAQSGRAGNGGESQTRSATDDDYEVCANRGEENGGSAWESNPPTARLSYGTAVLKTEATTRCAGTSDRVFYRQFRVYSRPVRSEVRSLTPAAGIPGYQRRLPYPFDLSLLARRHD